MAECNDGHGEFVTALATELAARDTEYFCEAWAVPKGDVYDYFYDIVAEAANRALDRASGGQAAGFEEWRKSRRACSLVATAIHRHGHARRGHGLIESLDQFGEAAYAAGQRSQAGWVSVEERLPEPNMPVLVIDEHGTLFTAYTPGTRRWLYVTNHHDCETHSLVTHWQPLPAPPAEEPSS